MLGLEGTFVGTFNGQLLVTDGMIVGIFDGTLLGTFVGTFERVLLGVNVRVFEGILLGLVEGKAVCSREGANVEIYESLGL